MYDDSDRPTIEEIDDTENSGYRTAEAIFQERAEEVSKQIKTLLKNPTTDDLKQVIRIMSRSIDEWAEEEDNEGSIRARTTAIKTLTRKRNDYEMSLARKENEFLRKRGQRHEEESMTRENPRRCSSFRDTDITRRTDRTGLNQSSYQGPSSNQQTHYYSSDEDYENRPRSNRDPYRYNDSPQRSHQSSMYQQRRDASPPLHRSHTTLNGTSGSQQVRMRSGKSRVTKTTARKYRPGQKALAEIRQYQKSTDLLIQKAPFARLVHEIIREESSQTDFRVRADALLALQEAAEAFMVEMFEGSVLICNHAKRVTLMPADIQLYRRLCLRNLY